MNKFKYSKEIDWSYHFESRYSTIGRKSGFPAKKRKASRSEPSLPKRGRGNYLYYGLIFIFLFILLFLISISFSYASPIKSYDIEESGVFSSDNSKELLAEHLLGVEEPENKKPALKNTMSQPISYKKYRVKRNETISHISSKFRLTNDTVILLNKIKHQKSLKAGTILIIPNQNGRLITIGKNDSIYKIANRYGVSWKKIVDVNNIESDILIAGKKIFIPEAGMTAYERKLFYKESEKKTVQTIKRTEKSKDKKVTTSGGFIWPLRGKITSAYGLRRDPFLKTFLFHKGVDIKGNMGEAVKSAKAGKVIYIGWNKIYGNILMIRHDSQYVTVYAHLSKVEAKNNQQVKQGEIVARVGNTGRSTGAHLHFEVRKNGKTLDPLKFLK